MPLVGLGLKAFQLLELKFFTSEGHLQQIGSNKLYLLYVPETGCGGAALSDLGTPDGNSNTQKHQRAVDAGAVPVRRKGRACCRYHTFLGHQPEFLLIPKEAPRCRCPNRCFPFLPLIKKFSRPDTS